MLGTLAKWLRFFGFDTAYVTEKISDDEILRIVEREQRMLLTRDKELIIRAEKKNIAVLCINSINLDTQLVSVLHQLKEPINKEAVLSRCSLCNDVLEKISKQQINDLVPPKVSVNQQDFWQCPNCKKIYWKGSHYENMIQKIQSLIDDA